jgi:hypothetical protein
MQTTWLISFGARSIRAVCHRLGTHLSAWQTPAAPLSAPHKPMIEGTHKRMLRTFGHQDMLLARDQAAAATSTDVERVQLTLCRLASAIASARLDTSVTSRASNTCCMVSTAAPPSTRATNDV